MSDEANQNDQKMPRPSPLNYEVLEQAIASAAALRCRRRLQPAGGPGDKVFPPTYAGAVYAVEERRVLKKDGGDEHVTVTCVLLDSVQSQANRMEEALQRAIDDGEIKLPLIDVDFTGADPDGTDSQEKLLKAVGHVTSLTAPHRLADAILRDSDLKDKKDSNGKPIKFRDSDYAKKWRAANFANATPIFEYCPTALLFGMWGSPEKPGGLGAKFERAIASEIVAIGCPSWLLQDPWKPQRYGVKTAPFEVSNKVAVIQDEESPTGWSITSDSKQKGALRPSEINHGNVTYPSLGKPQPNVGITADVIEQTTTLSLIQLRRLAFPPVIASKATPGQNVAARTMLAAIGLCGAVLAFERGADLRSRCVVFPEGPMIWELLDLPGNLPRQFSLDRAGAIKLLKKATESVISANLPWATDTVLLTPSKQLIELVRKSQEITAKADAD